MDGCKYCFGDIAHKPDCIGIAYANLKAENGRLKEEFRLAEDERIEWVKRGESAEDKVARLLEALALARSLTDDPCATVDLVSGVLRGDVDEAIQEAHKKLGWGKPRCQVACIFGSENRCLACGSKRESAKESNNG